MRLRTFLAATVLAATTLLAGVGSAAAQSDPQDPPPSTSSHGNTGIGINLLCGLGLLAPGSCSN
ncbi:hypothetical protein [Streptomyces sp. NPDC048111]|uniref:hypothetical protein n=1 Tax=Streptomyces sp. NPDC048111 TaxID=3365500 RepID=UPI003717895B